MLAQFLVTTAAVFVAITARDFLNAMHTLNNWRAGRVAAPLPVVVLPISGARCGRGPVV